MTEYKRMKISELGQARNRDNVRIEGIIRSPQTNYPAGLTLSAGAYLEDETDRCVIYLLSFFPSFNDMKLEKALLEAENKTAAVYGTYVARTGLFKNDPYVRPDKVDIQSKGNLTNSPINLEGALSLKK